MPKPTRSYAEFWPRYLAEHRHPGTRALHMLGTGLAAILAAAAIVAADWRWLVAAMLCGYAFAWLSHLLIERNRPATFRHPLWSFVSDIRMLLLWLTGRLARELGKHRAVPPRSDR